MLSDHSLTHPILTCAQATQFERELLRGDEALELAALKQAGTALAAAVEADYAEIAPFPRDGRLLVLAGKGFNGGDAVVAAGELLDRHPEAEATVLLVFGREALKPLAQRMLENLIERHENRVAALNWSDGVLERLGRHGFDVCFDGMVGYQFEPPLRAPAPEVIRWSAEMGSRIVLRAAVDLPSGLGEVASESIFQADFTYCMGVAKAPLFTPVGLLSAGRVRYLDIGFFREKRPEGVGEIAQGGALRPLRALRPADADKRSFGHLYVMAGSRFAPGAQLMTLKAALQAGVGLLTAFVPGPVSARAAAAVPEAMWAPLPASADGLLSSEALSPARQALQRATALVMGPGVEPTREIRYFVGRMVREGSLPTVIDATALQPDLLTSLVQRPSDAPPVVLTPHAGEFQRMTETEELPISDARLRDFCEKHRAIVLLKGPVTRVCDGKRLVHVPAGGPVLARGGSGDILSGILGALIAKPGADAFEATVRAVLWHGRAANALARARGQQAVHTTELLDYLSPVLRHA